MFSKMMRTVHAADSLYFAPAQQRELLEYARSLPARFAAARAVQAAEAGAVKAALDALAAAHPHLADPAEAGWATADADLRLTLRTLAQAALMDDPDFLEAKVLGHLRRTLAYLDLPPGASQAAFAGLAEAAAKALPAEVADLLAPHLAALVASMDPAEAAELAR